MRIAKLGVVVLVALPMAWSVAGCGSGAEDSAPRQTIGGGTVPPVPVTPAGAGSSGPMTSAPVSSGAVAGVPSPSTPAGPPVLPAVGKTNTKAGAEAFAKWYLQSVDYAAMHPEAGLPAAALDSCQSCTSNQRSVEAMAASGERNSGSIYEFLGVSADPFVPGAADVKVSLRQKSVAVINSKGETVRHTAAAEGAAWPTLVWSQSGWKVAKIRAEVA